MCARYGHAEGRKSSLKNVLLSAGEGPAGAEQSG